MVKSNAFKLIKNIANSLAVLMLFTFTAKAAEITAIDFNGDILGKIIPDGKVVSLDNQLIGNVTADSLVLDFDGNLIGGVIPQGIAIGNDNRPLGKVNNDGSVRLSSGKVVGRVLPTGLVVDDSFNVIGAVLFPGLIYSPQGRTIGRLTGDGVYANLSGEEIGFVSADGYAYRKIGTDVSLEGRLISSKMVASVNGEFMGSVVPGGKVTNFDANIIGSIKANGLVYNDEGRVIGGIINNAYAFDSFGNYLGIVSYNGEVVNKDQLIGHIAVNDTILDLEGNVIGFKVDLASTATDLEGRYLGRVGPRGEVIRGRDKVGNVGARGFIFDDGGRLIGKIINTGPVFDHNGIFKAQALKNGRIILTDGASVGYIKGDIAFDNGARVIGATQDRRLAFSNDNAFLGVTDIDSTLTISEEKLTVSPFGYVFSANGDIIGQSLKSKDIYNINGSMISSISVNGEIVSSSAGVVGKVTQGGYALDERNHILGKSVCSSFAVNDLGNALGFLSRGNLILDTAKKIVSKVLPDDSVVATNKINSVELMPQTGKAFPNGLIFGFDGTLIGQSDYTGQIKDLNNNPLGRMTSGNQAVDNTGSLIGGMIDYKTFVGNTCQVLGGLSVKGDVRNFRDVFQGRVLLNNQLFSESGDIIGYSYAEKTIIDDKGNILGIVSNNGQVVNYAGESLGCVDRRGLLRTAEGALIGGVLEYAPVINYKDKMIGRITLDGSVVSDANQFIGYVQPNGNVNSKTGIPIGAAFKYKVAFDNNNKFLGRVLSDGTVISSKGEELGSVDFDGYVTSKNSRIGYALYDMYIYNNDFSVIGYITKDGNIMSLTGSNIGVLDRGFFLNKNFQLSGRGNRDFNIRNESNIIIGELGFDGILTDSYGRQLGTLQDDGGIVNEDGNFIASAKPLQYYNKIVDRPKIFDTDGSLVGYLHPDGTVLNEDGKVVGIMGPDGLVRDASGNIIGGMGVDWYEKAEPYIRDKRLPQVGVSSDGRGGYDDLGDKARRSVNIALTPDGEYLGEVRGDGSVVGEGNKVIGQRMPDGLIIDKDGTLIGIEESKRLDTGDMFVPAGTFGSGGAYGTGSGPGGNLGPGGGFGPGERYDPQRAAALSAAQNERRKNMGVGKISGGFRKEAFDMRQKNWDEQGINKAISSWRVDMSEMILSDKPIPAVIARSIDSNNPTPVTAFVERNVYAEDGRNVIIPAGSRLIGTLGSLTATAEATATSAKVQISWDRLIRPDGVIFVFQGITGDAQGRGGALGYLDQQLFKKYTLPLMTTALTSYTSYLMAPSKEEENTSTESPKQQAANDARQNFLNQMNIIFERILQDKADIKPLTYVPAGTRIIVYPNVDLWLRTPERDDEVSTADLQKRDVLIDDKQEAAKSNAHEARRTREFSGSGGSSVVYDADDGGAEAVSRPVLIDDNTNKRSRQTTSTGTPPPPPPSYSVTPGASASAPSSSSGSSSSSSSNVPQLF